MIIKSLELENFRNYDSLILNFDEGTNILYGDNAQGKTNVLEAIYVSATTKSHKGSKDKEIINFDKEEAHIRTFLSKGDMDYRVDMHLRKSKSKGIAINGQKLKKAAELLGLLNVVFFSPEDLSIIKDGPSGRRSFVDMELCQLDKYYLYQYNKIINQRNKLLKDFYFNPDLKDTITVWDWLIQQLLGISDIAVVYGVPHLIIHISAVGSIAVIIRICIGIRAVLIASGIGISRAAVTTLTS